MITETDILRDHISKIVFPRLNEMLYDELSHIKNDLKLNDAMVNDLCYAWFDGKIKAMDYGLDVSKEKTNEEVK